MRTALLCLALLSATPALAEPLPASIAADAPKDAAHPAGMVAFALPTKGAKINAVLWTAAGAGKHPTVLLLHGLPGNEQNLDLARTMQREGWNVLTLHYRGSWGSPGQFSFAHCIEDGQAALAWLRDPNTAQATQIDASKLVVIGHSMGGFVTSWLAGHDPDLLGAALISAANMGARGKTMPREQLAKFMDDNIGTSIGMRTVNTSPEALADEAIRNGKDWNTLDWAGAMAKRPLLIVSSDDGGKPNADALTGAVTAAGGAPTRVHIATDHGYDDSRIALQAAVVRWLENLPGAPAGL